jgi:hypothetical protein
MEDTVFTRKGMDCFECRDYGYVLYDERRVVLRTTCPVCGLIRRTLAGFIYKRV